MADRVYLYQASAVGFYGRVTLPFQETIEGQATCALPIGGGYSQATVENYKCRNMVSVGLAKSQTIGNFSEKDNAYFSMASVVLEKINIMDVVTCDRLTMRISSKAKNVSPSVESEVTPIGCCYENLMIDGRRYDIEMATGLFDKYGTFSSLNSTGAKSELSSLSLAPPSGNVYGYTMVGNESSLGIKDHQISVPHFGTIRLARLYCWLNKRSVSMLEVTLGCPGEGDWGYGGGSSNGETFPP